MGFGKRDKSPTMVLQELHPAYRPRPEPERKPVVVNVAGALNIVINRSAYQTISTGVDRYALVQAVVNYVTAMMQEGLYARSEVPARAMQVYQIDHYINALKTDGHGQFIRNSASRASVFADIRTGLGAMGAHDHLNIFERMIAWMEANPEFIDSQGEIEEWQAAPLNKLDSDYFAASRLSSIGDQMARWISTWQDLSVVEESDYAATLRRVAELNPKRGPRTRRRSIDSLTYQLTDVVQAAMGMACASIDEQKLAVGGGSYQTVDGESRMTFAIRTSKALRFCVLGDEFAAIHERIEGASGPDISDIEWLKPVIEAGRLVGQHGPQVGRRLTIVDAPVVAAMTDLIKTYNVPAAMDLALRRANVDPVGAVAAPVAVDPHETGPIARCFVVVGNRGYHLFATASGAMLMNSEAFETLARVNPDEIAEHERQVKAEALA